ncbi:hypothetical protein KC19_8G111800 [Ceratodon purpureus]|uniref:HSF-type DNA-binding domain-containing protein n=1 Tax=Ceratodon purpureus TaxID=3225 RepID=A0A8T0H2X8_CERPU|nr:hypothetical protein KC19_8G111800 [Ceratodon purpureus]
MSLSFDNSEAGCMLFYDCHRSVPAPFLTKTYHLVNDPSTNEIVSWGEDDTTFVVWRPPEFARDLLPNYFKHNNFSSFVRQLNTYGFRKVVPDRWEFANDFFRRGERHLLCEIHRRKALQPASGTSGSAQLSRSLSPSTSVEDQAWASPISSPLPSPIPVHIVPTHHSPPITTPLSISDENERLRKDNNLLLSEVSRLRRLYEDTINMIQYQFKGSSPDFTTPSRIGPGGQPLDRAMSTVTALSGESAMHHWDRLGPVPARREENRELSVHVSNPTSNHEVYFCKNVPPSPHLIVPQQQHQQVEIGDSKLSFYSENSPSSPTLSSKAEVAEGAGKVPVKLFGVPLHSQGNLDPVPWTPALAGTKRQQPETWDVSEQPHDRVFLRPPPRKCLRTSEMASELSSTVQAPWLQICATRDEGVYI